MSSGNKFIIGVTGKSCSGKTTISHKLQSRLGNEQCLLISMDDFYKELTPEQQSLMRTDDSVVNFDSPEAIDFELLKKTLRALRSSNKEGDLVELPKFDPEKCVITSWSRVASGNLKYVIVEGLFLLHDPELAKCFDFKIWVETRDYVCALRRFMKFSTLLKGYTHDYIYNQCIRFVIPGQEKYIKPTKIFCDIFANGEIDDTSSLNMIVNYITKND